MYLFIGKMSAATRYETNSGSSSPSNPSASASYTAHGSSQRASRRSSMNMLKNMSNSELAGIVSGALPNPVADTPPTASSSSSAAPPQPPPLTIPVGSNASTGTSSASPEAIKNVNTAGISAYQHSLHSLLRRQFSNKRMTNRRSMSSSVDTPPDGSGRLTSSNPEADKDVVEINLDSDDTRSTAGTAADGESHDGTFDSHHHDHHHLQTPIYPAMLLNATQSGYDFDAEHDRLSCHPLAVNASTSAPELSRWEQDEDSDYFIQCEGKLLRSIVSNPMNADQRSMIESPSTCGQSLFETDEAYGERLYLSRTAKLKRWCSFRSKESDHHHLRSSPRPMAQLSRVKEQDRPHMPKILVTSEEIDQDADGEALHENDKLRIVNDIPWVDWLEEYRVIKDAEMERRRSTGSQPEKETPHHHHHHRSVTQRLAEWWHIVKSSAEGYTTSHHVPHVRRHSDMHWGFSKMEHHRRSSLSLEKDHSIESSTMFEKPKLRRCLTSPTENDLSAEAHKVAATQQAAPPPPPPSSTSTSRDQDMESPIAADYPDVKSATTPRISPRKTASHTTSHVAGYRFNNPVGQRSGLFGRLGKIFGINSESDDRHSSLRVQNTIRSRLQNAKDQCDLTMRSIIDDLNEYVERGLQYVEDMDEILERGVQDMSSGEENVSDTDTEYGTVVNDAAATTPTTATPVDMHYNQTTNTAQQRRSRTLPTALQDIQEQEETDDHPPPPPVDDGHYAEDASSQVNNMVTLISEDSYLPTPFILTLQDLIALAQSVMDTPLDVFLEYSGSCAELVSKIQMIGTAWDQHPEWPCREWYVKLLLSVAALNRVLDWWEAERAFWAAGQQSSPAIRPASDVDTGTTTDLESMTEGDSSTGYERQRFPTNSSSEVGSAIPSRLLASGDETTSISSGDDGERMEIMDDNADMQEAEGANSTIIMELSLGTAAVQYVSPVWLDVIG